MRGRLARPPDLFHPTTRGRAVIFIWRRRGWLVPVLFLACFVAVQLLVDLLMGSGYYTSHRPAHLGATIFTSLVVSAVGVILNHRNRNGGSKHSFFFIPIEFWGLILFAVMLLSLL